MFATFSAGGISQGGCKVFVGSSGGGVFGWFGGAFVVAGETGTLTRDCTGESAEKKSMLHYYCFEGWRLVGR